MLVCCVWLLQSFWLIWVLSSLFPPANTTTITYKLDEARQFLQPSPSPSSFHPTGFGCLQHPTSLVPKLYVSLGMRLWKEVASYSDCMSAWVRGCGRRYRLPLKSSIQVSKFSAISEHSYVEVLGANSIFIIPPVWLSLWQHVPGKCSSCQWEVHRARWQDKLAAVVVVHEVVFWGTVLLHRPHFQIQDYYSHCSFHYLENNSLPWLWS